MVFRLVGFAQVQWYRSTSFANKTAYGWSNWQDSNVQICINLNTDVITIYSPTVQVYKVVRIENPPYDDSGNQVKFRVVNPNGYYAYVRLRVENNGNSQIYVDFPGDGTSICYNVIRTS